MRFIKQSTAYPLTVLMVDSADHNTGKTGLTLIVTASKAGSSYTSITPTVTELSGGSYSIALTTTHTNTLGDLALRITATGADTQDVFCQVLGLDLFDSVRGGMTSLPNAAASASGGLLTYGTSTGQVNPTSGKVPATLAATDVTGNVPADLQTIKTQTVTASAGVTFPPSGTLSTYAGGAVAGISAGGITAASFATDAITSTVLAASAVSEIVAGVLAGTVTESYAASGATPTVAQILSWISAAVTSYDVTGTALSVYGLDGSTVVGTCTLNSSTNPTSRKRTS